MWSEKLKVNSAIWLVELFFVTLLLLGCTYALPNITTPTVSNEQSIPSITSTLTSVPQSSTPSPTHSLTPSPTATLTPIPTATMHLPVVQGTKLPSPKEIIHEANIDKLVPLKYWGQGSIQDVAFSPDGSLMAMASTGGVFIYDVHSLKLIDQFTTQQPVTTCLFSPDGTIIAIGELEGGVSLLQKTGDGYVEYKIKQTTPIYDEISYGDIIDFLNFSPDGRILIANSWRVLPRQLNGNGPYSANDTYLWRLKDRSLITTLSDVDASKTAFSKDGTELIIPKDNKIQFYNIPEEKVSKEFDAYFANRIQASPDGKLIAVNNPESIRILRVDDGSLMNAFSGTNITFAPNSLTVAIDNNQGVIQTWRLSEDRTRFIPSISFIGYSFLNNTIHNLDHMAGVSFSPTGKFLTLSARSQQFIQGDQNNLRYKGRDELLIYDTVSGLLLKSEQVVSIKDDPTASAGDPSYPYSYHPTIYKVVFSPDETKHYSVASSYNDNRSVIVRKWRIDSKESEGLISSDYPQSNMALAFSPNGQFIASGWDWKFPIFIRSVNDGKVIKTFTNNTGRPISNLVFSTDGKYLYAYHSYFHNEIFWDLSNDTEVTGKPFTPTLAEFDQITKQ